jgi:uncharacterized protein YllA (UPF0747 family)
MVTQKRTVHFFNEETEARRALKKYGKGYEIRQHPKWHTWDVVKVIKTKPTKKRVTGFGFPRPNFRY